MCPGRFQSGEGRRGKQVAAHYASWCHPFTLTLYIKGDATQAEARPAHVRLSGGIRADHGVEGKLYDFDDFLTGGLEGESTPGFDLCPYKP